MGEKVDLSSLIGLSLLATLLGQHERTLLFLAFREMAEASEEFLKVQIAEKSAKVVEGESA